MKTSQTLLAVAILSTSLLTATGANAALESRLGGAAVYDTDRNITWLSNANLAATNPFGLDRNVDLGGIPGVNTYGGSYIFNNGSMTWGGAMKWIGAMNAANYLGYHDWRLPDTLPPNAGDPSCNARWNCTGSEMGHLFYNELGGVATLSLTGPSNNSIADTHNANYSLFQNLQPSDQGVQPNSYWSGTGYEFAPEMAWSFGVYYGDQSVLYKSAPIYALTVRSGDVAAVPLPGAAWLLGSGLLGLIGAARRRFALQ